MLRAHATFFETRPDSELLREHLSPATGFRLLRHVESGVYLIESDDADFDTSAFSILETKKTPRFRTIKSALKSEEKTGRLEWGSYRPSDINDAIWLSSVFQSRVMIAYFDDDGGDMVAIAHSGQLERACIKGTPIDEEGEACYEIEMLTPEAATYRKIERESWNDIFEREFKLTFGQDTPDLTDEAHPEFDEIDCSKGQGGIKRLLVLILTLVAATVIVSALLGMLHTSLFPTEKISTGETSATFEEACAGELSSKMQEICDEFDRLQQKRNSEDPK